MCKNLSWLWLLSSPPATLYIIVEPPTSPMESQHLKPFRISNLFSLLNQSRISSIQLFQTFSGWSLRNDICEQIFKNECLEKEYPNVCLIVFWASLSNMPNPVYLKYSKLTWTCMVKFSNGINGRKLGKILNYQKPIADIVYDAWQDTWNMNTHCIGQSPMIFLYM